MFQRKAPAKSDMTKGGRIEAMEMILIKMPTPRWVHAKRL
jgi:hypothetical protein